VPALPPVGLAPPVAGLPRLAWILRSQRALRRGTSPAVCTGPAGWSHSAVVVPAPPAELTPPVATDAPPVVLPAPAVDLDPPVGAGPRLFGSRTASARATSSRFSAGYRRRVRLTTSTWVPPCDVAPALDATPPVVPELPPFAVPPFVVRPPCWHSSQRASSYPQRCSMCQPYRHRKFICRVLFECSIGGLRKQTLSKRLQLR